MMPGPQVAEVHITINLDSVLAVVVTIVFLIVMSSASTRLLGFRLSRLRGLAASVLGWIIGLAGAAGATRHGTLSQFYALAVIFGVLATMVMTIIIEVLTVPHPPRDRSKRRKALLHPVSWLRQRLSPIGRFREVARHARRRGLARFRFFSSDAVGTAEFGRRLRLTLEDSGGMFVKFGQIASTRSDLLSESVVQELSQLRASVRPIPTDELRPLIEEELGQAVEEVFDQFEWEPMAAASIGQTHRATLKGGAHVVVKIQRPGLEELLGRDAAVLRFGAGIVERRMPGARQLGIRDLSEELILGMERELDYGREASMSNRMASEAGEDAQVGIPAVFEDVSTGRLLVIEEVVGKSVDDTSAIVACEQTPRRLARDLLQTFLGQVVRGGVYHADPHPGNVMVDRPGKLWLLDFGAVGILDATTRQSVQDIAVGLSIGEPLIVARAVRRMGGSDSADLRLLEADVGMLMVEGGGGRFDPRIIHQVLAIMSHYGLRVPRSMSQLSRAMLTLDGTLRIIDPTFDLATEATQFIQSLSGGQQGVADDMLKTEVLRAMPILRALPEQVDELATQLRGGRMTLRTERFSGGDRSIVEGWIDRILVLAVGAAGGIMSALLLLAANLSHGSDIRDALRAIGFIGLVFSCVLLMRTAAQALQYRQRAPRPGRRRIGEEGERPSR